MKVHRNCCGNVLILTTLTGGMFGALDTLNTHHVSYFCPQCHRDLYHSADDVEDPDEHGTVTVVCSCGRTSRWDFDRFTVPIRLS